MATLLELWAELRATADTTPGFALRLFAAAHDLRLYAALKTPEGLPAIVVEMPNADRPPDLASISTRAFEALSAQFPGLPPGRAAISIALRQVEYEDLFEHLGIEIGAAIQSASSSQQATRTIIRQIDRWRRFLERTRRGLSDEQVRGLFGELAVLARCVGQFGPVPAVDAWQGMGGLRDLELPSYSVEVKTYQAETGAAVRLNDPQQIEGSPARPVYLATARLALSNVNGRTLPEVIAILEQQLHSEPSAVETFRDRLADYGYMAVEAARYTERFVIINLQLFAIRDGFPRILAASIPPGVVDVHFSIILSAMANYAVDPIAVIGGPTPMETF